MSQHSAGMRLVHPHCFNMQEEPSAISERKAIGLSLESEGIPNSSGSAPDSLSPLQQHIYYGLAYTIGSAIGSVPPTKDDCLAAFLTPNSAGLTAGARAWSKHSHRSGSEDAQSRGWWGIPKGPVAKINEMALALFHKVVGGASWRNLHWLPHRVLVYEARVPEGYGMRWSKDMSKAAPATGKDQETDVKGDDTQWILRGFVEPMMENGHEVGWRH